MKGREIFFSGISALIRYKDKLVICCCGDFINDHEGIRRYGDFGASWG